MKTTRAYIFLLAVFFCLTTAGLAQSNAKHDYKHQHQAAQKYQKSMRKQQRKQQEADAKQAKAYRKEHAQ